MKITLTLCLANLLAISVSAQNSKTTQTDAIEENLEYSIEAGKNIYAMAASPDGDVLAYSIKSKVVFVNFENGKLIKEIDVDDLTESFAQKDKIKPYFGYIRAIDYTPDGKKMAIGFIGGLVLIDLKKPAILWYSKGVRKSQGIDSATAVYSVKCASNHVYAASIDDSRLYCWNISDGSLHSVIATEFAEIENFALTHDSKNSRIVISGNNGLAYYKINGEKIWAKKTNSRGVISISPNDSLLAYGTANFGSTVFLINLDNPDKSSNLGPAGDRSPGGVAWSIFKKSVYSCCIGMGNAPVMQFSVVKDETVRTEITMDFDSEPDCSNNCLVGGAGFLLAVAGKDKTIHVYKIER